MRARTLRIVSLATLALCWEIAGRSGNAHLLPPLSKVLAVWFELRFGQKPLLAFGMLGVGLFSIGVLAGLVALGVLFFSGVSLRWVWTLIQTCLLLGSIFFATGILGEQVAVTRAEQRELRRLLDEVKQDRRGR